MQTASAAGRGLSNPASSFGRASAAPGGLASLGEDVEVGQEEQAQAAVLHRQGGPRFAGNIAFQSAVARHAAQQAAQQGNQDSRSSLAHQRQLSLQGRFADLGYNLSGNGGLGPVPNEMDDMTDDGASSVDFVGGANFDPTRQPRQQGHDFSQLGELNHNFNLSNTSQSQSHGAHRRTGSDMSGMQAGRIGHMHAASLGGNLGGNLGGGNGMGPGSQLLAEQMALQQQIEVR